MNKAYWIVTGVLVASLATLLVFQGTHLFAQDPWGGGPGGPDGPRGGQNRMMPRMGGGSALAVMGKYVFVTSGTQLVKVDGESMTVVKTLEMPGARPDFPRDPEKKE